MNPALHNQWEIDKLEKAKTNCLSFDLNYNNKNKKQKTDSLKINNLIFL